MEHSCEALETASLAAQLLLKSGAEIYRVQETACRILDHFGVSDYNVYVIANGFFINVDEGGEQHRTAIRNVPLQSVNLTLITEVNQISRQLCDNAISEEEALERLKLCARPVPENRLLMIAASGIGAMGFCYLFGGTVIDSLLSLLLGLVLQLVLYGIGARERYLGYLVGAFLMTAGAALFRVLLPGSGFHSIVIGAIIPLVPGVAFTTSINELFHGDHVSGTIHLLDSVLTAFCIAAGVATAILCVRWLGGAVTW